MNRTKMLIASLVVGALGAMSVAQAADKGLVGVSMPTKSSARWIDDGNNMVKELKGAGYSVDLQYAEDDIPNQLAQIENMVTKGVKVLVIASIDGTTLSDVLQKAADKGDKARDEAERAKAEAALLDKPLVPEKFYLQAGAFEDPSEADNLKARLALMGVEASVQKVDVPDKGTMHRVRTGPYLGQEAMSKARDNLSSNGINTAVVKIKPKEPKPAPAAQ